MLAFTSVYFLESGLINGLRPFGVKSFSALRPYSHHSSDISLPVPSSIRAHSDLGSATGNGIARIPVCWKILFAFRIRWQFGRNADTSDLEKRIEAFFEVFSSGQRVERDRGNATEGSLWVVTMHGHFRADKAARRRRLSAGPIGWPNPAQPSGNLVAELSCASTKRSTGRRSPNSWKAPVRFRVILAVAAFSLAGCNANQAVNPSSRAPSQVFAGHYEAANPYDPITATRRTTPVAAATKRQDERERCMCHRIPTHRIPTVTPGVAFYLRLK